MSPRGVASAPGIEIEIAGARPERCGVALFLCCFDVDLMTKVGLIYFRRVEIIGD